MRGRAARRAARSSDLVDDEESYAAADDEVVEASHEEVKSGPGRTVGDLEGPLHLVGHGGLPEVLHGACPVVELGLVLEGLVVRERLAFGEIGEVLG